MILLAHEFGHYLAAVFHRVDASLPYFLPSPFLGTFGAFIRVRSPIYSKRALFDIGIAGPLAGFVFLVPALAVGHGLLQGDSRHRPPGQPCTSAFPACSGCWSTPSFPGVAPADIYLHPVARAAWVGMFATAMNLLPIGQLDGGHILYSFFPAAPQAPSSRALCLLMLPLGKFWLRLGRLGASFCCWLGRRHPVIYDSTVLSAGRRKLGWLALVIFILCFTYRAARRPADF